MQYVVQQVFQDKFTGDVYRVGEPFESDDPDRLKDLKSRQLIAESSKPADSVWPRHIAAGNYELSNGEKVKGKEQAHAAQAALNAGDQREGKQP